MVRFIPTYVGYTFSVLQARGEKLVHPHIRGVYTKWRGRSTATWRFIPTYVGYTSLPVSIINLHPVHPHIRGVYHVARLTAPVPAGSSPHTWGILVDSGHSCNQGRFIPTYVGYTPKPQASSAILPVHPHIRGVYQEGSAYNKANVGSSPHTWGIRSGTSYQGGGQPVHPHIRGVYFVPEKPTPPSIGSSPHTWGILQQQKLATGKARFIPTYVGHTLDRRKKNGWFQPLLL